MMDDLVKKQDVIKAIHIGSLSARTIFGRSEAGMTTLKDTIRAIEELPSAQPEIIRCRDCRESRRYINTDITFCDRTEVEVKDDDFCSHAKKMGVEHD